jgi:hypothetical protein
MKKMTNSVLLEGYQLIGGATALASVIGGCIYGYMKRNNIPKTNLVRDMTIVAIPLLSLVGGFVVEGQSDKVNKDIEDVNRVVGMELYQYRRVLEEKKLEPSIYDEYKENIFKQLEQFREETPIMFKGRYENNLDSLEQHVNREIKKYETKKLYEKNNK